MKTNTFLRKATVLLISAGLFMNIDVQAQIPELRAKLGEIIGEYDVKAGVSVRIPETGDTLSFFGNDQFPMQSVYKFHLAIAVYQQLLSKELSAMDSILITPADLLPDTWSPIREKYPQGNIRLTLQEIIRYTVSESDNNGCDILFRWIGGPEMVQHYFHLAGFKEIRIEATEEEMHKDWAAQFRNTCTPNSAVSLLESFFNKDILSEPYQQILWKQMVESTTGADRLKKLLPEGTIIAHKTGSSGKNDKGITAAANDIGIICLPDGNHLVLAVFITESKESSRRNDELIARIAYETYHAFTVK